MNAREARLYSKYMEMVERWKQYSLAANSKALRVEHLAMAAWFKEQARLIKEGPDDESDEDEDE
jgi:hypothetical protein